jgi:hypothetical protein
MVGFGHLAEHAGETQDIPVERFHALHVPNPDADVIYP